MEKSARKTIGRPFKKGGDPRQGRGPRPGTGGRPRDEWKAALRELVSSDAALERLGAILADPTHPQFLRAMEFAAERGFGKEAQALEGELRLTVIRRDESASGSGAQ